jgi:hypothetical protein
MSRDPCARRPTAKEKPMSRMPIPNLLAAACAVALAAPAIAQAPAKEPMTAERTSTPGTVAGGEVEQVSATVTAVDVEKRLITLKGPKGQTETMKVGPEVINLPQVKVGDKVQVRFYRGFALQFLPPGTPAPAPAATGSVTAAAPGEKPAGEAKVNVVATVTIKSIDMKTRIVELQGEGGNVYRVKAGKDVQIDKVKAGDKLLATYSEGLAVEVVAAPAKKKGKK